MTSFHESYVDESDQDLHCLPFCLHLLDHYSPKPSLFAHVKYGSRLKVRPKFRHLALLDGCACAFEE